MKGRFIETLKSKDDYVDLKAKLFMMNYTSKAAHEEVYSDFIELAFDLMDWCDIDYDLIYEEEYEDYRLDRIEISSPLEILDMFNMDSCLVNEDLDLIVECLAHRLIVINEARKGINVFFNSKDRTLILGVE